MMTSSVLPTPQEAGFFFFSSSTSAAQMTFTLDKLYLIAHRFPLKIPMVLSSPTSLDSSIDIQALPSHALLSQGPLAENPTLPHVV